MIITNSTIKKVYSCKKASVDTMQHKGYKLIKELFVDKSGFGAEDEPALTQSQFINELEQLISEYGSLTAKITSEGQFQVYIGLFKKADKSKMIKIANNTYRIETNTGYKIRLHDTDILEFDNDKIIIDTGGFFTKTTKDRLNSFLPAKYYIYQHQFNWYIKDKDKNIDIPFKENTLILE